MEPTTAQINFGTELSPAVQNYIAFAADITGSRNLTGVERTERNQSASPTQTHPAATAATPTGLVRNLRGGVGRAPDPGRTRGGVEASSSSLHARQITALYHRQLAIHIRKASRTLRSWIRESSVGGLAEELHGSGAKEAQCFKRYRSEHRTRAVLVRK
jgi:hypothetical protein